MKWVIAEQLKADVYDLHKDLPPLMLQLLYNRGLKTAEAMYKFLNPDYVNDLHDPFLFTDMDKAVNRIYAAFEKQEKIIIYGDYDADGICSSVVLSATFDKLQFSNYEVRLPHREKEGYGLNQAAIDEIIASGATLVITLDCGTTNIQEVARLADSKIDTIIVDHHVVGLELPKAYAFVNPKRLDDTYPYKDLATVGLAFKLSSALFSRSALPKQEVEIFLKWILDLVATATVTDIVSLLGENRVLLKYGLVVLNKTRRIGFKHLIESSSNTKKKSREITEHEIGFYIGPRINAASRMGHAITAYNLLTASDDEVAKPLIAELDKHNKNRQGLVSDVVKHAIDQISELDAQKKVIVVFSEKCTAGIAGIVASKIIDKYSRPVLVVGKGESGFVGSGRSVDGFHITNIINQLNIETQNSLFLRCGGHAKACGFTLNSIEDIGILREKINNIADTVLADFAFDKQINIDAVINLDDVDLRLYKELRKFEPHGMSNPKPKFLSKGVIISVLSQVGIGNKHLRLLVNSSETNQKRYKCIGFGLGQIADSLAVGGQADIVFEIDIDEWNGYTDIQLVLCDIRPAS